MDWKYIRDDCNDTKVFDFAGFGVYLYTCCITSKSKVVEMSILFGTVAMEKNEEKQLSI